MSRNQLILGTTFRDLNDPIFTYLTLALLFSAFIYCYLCRKRYIFISVIAILFLGTSLAITFIEGYWSSPYLLFRIYLIPRWVIAPIFWSFIGGLALWTIFVTARVLMGLTPRF